MQVSDRTPTKQFLGLISSADPNDLPAGGMQTQNNLVCTIPGALTVRKGIQLLNTRGTYDIIALYWFHRPEADWLVWENTNGDVIASKLPALASNITIGTGYNTFQPLAFAKSRENVLIGVNGIDRGFRWDGLTATVEPLGIDAPVAAPTMTASSGGAATAGDYLCAYRYIDNDIAFVNGAARERDSTAGPIPSSLSPDGAITVTANQLFIWSSLSASSQSRVVGVEFWRTLAFESETYYQLEFTNAASATVTFIGYSGSLTSEAASSGNTNFTVPAGHNLVVGAKILVAGCSVSGYNTTHIVTAVTATTVKTDQTHTSNGSGGTWTLTGYTNDVIADVDLETHASMALLQVDGIHLNARRFVPPPNTKPLICFLQDRMFLGGVVHYTQGTVSTTAGSATVTGSSTNWTATMVGRFMYIVGEPYPYTVTAYSSATSLTISNTAVNSLSGVGYAIDPAPDERNTLIFAEQDEPESMPSTNLVVVQENTGDDDEIKALSPYASAMVVAKDRHLYTVRFFRQPDIDAQPYLMAYRGAVNGRCHCLFEEGTYWLDQLGVYSYAQGTKPISAPIQDLFRPQSSTRIDFTNAKWFFATSNPLQDCIRFYVQFNGDSGTRPTRWLEYNIRSGAWHTGSTTEQLGGAAMGPYSSGALRLYLGGQTDSILLSDQGNTDVISAQVRGTATSGGSTTLTDTNTTFAATVVGAPLAIIAGTGKNQVRRISARGGTGNHQLTVDTAWTTNPDPTSVYLVGAIAYLCKTGRYDLSAITKLPELSLGRNIFRISYAPTATAATLDTRLYYNNDSSPTNATQNQNIGSGWVATINDPDAVLNLYLNRSAQQAQIGYGIWTFNAYDGDRAIQGSRTLAIELRGFQGDDTIQIFDLALDQTK